MTEALYVVFKRGEAWVYHGVPEATYATLRSSRSIGSHFMRHVRNAFEAEKIGDEAALLARIANSAELTAALAQAEREAQLRAVAAHQRLNAMINRTGRVYVAM